MTGAADNRGNRTQYQRDAFGRITSKTQFIADDPGVASNYTTRYAYSSAGELSQISYPSGLNIYYRRNASGQMTGIDSQQRGADKPVALFVSDLAYTALGQPRNWRWASGDAAARGFDADGRMAGNEFASYSYDANGNRLSASIETDADAGLDGDSGPSDTAKTSAQAMNIDSASNRLLGFVQTQSLQCHLPVNFSLNDAGKTGINCFKLDQRQVLSQTPHQAAPPADRR